MKLFLFILFFQTLSAVSITDRIAYDRIVNRADQDDWQSIKSDLASLLVENYTDAELLYDMGVAASKCDACDEALSYFTDAAQLQQNKEVQFQSYYNAGNIAVAQNNVVDAINLYEHALEIIPDNMYAQHNLEQAKKLLEQQEQEQQNNNQEDKKDEQNNDQDQNDQQENKDDCGCNSGQDKNQNGDQDSSDDQENKEQESSGQGDNEQSSDGNQSNENDQSSDGSKENEQGAQDQPEEPRDEPEHDSERDTEQEKGNDKQEHEQNGNQDQRQQEDFDNKSDGKQSGDGKEDELEHNNPSESKEDQIPDSQDTENSQQIQQPSFAEQAEALKSDIEDEFLAQLLQAQEEDDTAINKRLMEAKLRSQAVGNHDQNNW